MTSRQTVPDLQTANNTNNRSKQLNYQDHRWHPPFMSIFIKMMNHYYVITSCRQAASTICPRLSPPPWAPKRKRPGDLDLWPFDLESGFRVTCDVGYLCANFGLPSPSVLDLGPVYATDRQRHQTDRRQTDVHHRLMPRLLGAGAQ